MQGDYAAAKGAIRLQTIHPGFVDTLACKDDGIPENNLISEEQAAEYIISGWKVIQHG